MTDISTILLPTRPQPDTVVAIYLLKKYGQEKLPGIAEASVRVKPELPEGEDFDSLLAQGTLALDLGGGALDHHNKNKCSSELVAQYLDIVKDPSITQLLAYAKRDDTQGKGTLSRDALDRAFGLSGLIAALNKANPDNPQYVVNSALPLLDAHWQSANEHHVELPRDVELKKQSGKYREHTARQGDKTFKMACVISDKPAMPTYLRSQKGGQIDVVVLKSESTNHMCILTRQTRGVDLSKIAALVRLREAELMGVAIRDNEEYLIQTGRVAEVPHWYFDPATNSLLNGGIHNRAVAESNINLVELEQIVKAGIELGGSRQQGERPAYYLSVNLPEDAARRITSSLEVSPGVKIHHPKKLHITLHHFGALTPAEAGRIARITAESLKDQKVFEITLHEGQLASGSPEGYTNTKAWYLAVEPEAASHINALRGRVLSTLGIQGGDKMLHITLAANRNNNTPAAPQAVRFAQSVEMTVPVREVVLMESAPQNGKRIYRVHSTFPLTP